MTASLPDVSTRVPFSTRYCGKEGKQTAWFAKKRECQKTRHEAQRPAGYNNLDVNV